jgi:mycothiol synthase
MTASTLTQTILPPMPTPLRLDSLDVRNISESNATALSDFWNAIRLERLPDDPAIPLSERLADWRTMPARVVTDTQVIWHNERIIAASEADFERGEENQHMVFSNVAVLADYRRQGLAKQLLAKLLEFPKREGRGMLMAWSSDKISAGSDFLAHIGAERGLEMHTNQLLLPEIPVGLLDTWIKEGAERAPDFALGFWPGAFPAEQLEDIARLIDVMNTAPRGDLNIEDEKTTPEKLRDFERQLAATGTVRWTVYAYERASGKFAGFTQTGWNPNREQILSQWGTGVFPEYRNHGLGRWLKAEMLRRVIAEQPSVTKVRTGNADSNGPMLNINHALGFKPYSADTIWQISVEAVERYLAGPS